MSRTTPRLRAERAAEALREQQRRERRRTTVTVIAVLAAITLIIAAGFLINRARDTTGEVAAVPAGSEYGLTIGPPDAPHEIVIYEDFLCPVCGELEAHSAEELGRLAEEGKVRVEYRPFELLGRFGDYSRRATAAFAVVLDRSGPEVAKKYHDLLFANQPSETGPFPDDDWLVDLAVRAGADRSEVEAPIKDGAGNDWVEAATDAALEAGVQGTPTILLDGQYFAEGRTMEQVAQNLVAAVS